MNILERYGPLAARILLALVFVLSGFSKLGDLDGTAGYIASKGLPLGSLLALGAGLVELLGGLSVLLGLRARWGALALVAFMIPTTLLFHNPMGLEGLQAQLELIQLNKNLAIMGGLLAVATFGSGAYSLDRRRPQARATAQPA